MRGVSLIGISAMLLFIDERCVIDRHRVPCDYLLIQGVSLIGISAMWLFDDEGCVIDRHQCHLAVC